MTVSYEQARAEATDYLAEADLHLARTGRLPSIPLPAELLRALLSGSPEPSEEAAERDVGRYLYQRLETLMDANSDSTELAWIAHIIGCVEEYGIEHCKGDELMAFPLASRPAVAEGWVLVQAVPGAAWLTAIEEAARAQWGDTDVNHRIGYRIHAALLSAEQGWREIESAPMDGRSVLVFCPRASDHGYERIRLTWRKDGKWQGANNTSWPPTHWMPLPAPPTNPQDER